MLRCKQVAERASLLIDGELRPWQRFNMKLHLAMCRGCRAFVEQMRITRDLTHMAKGSDYAVGKEIIAALAEKRSRAERRT